MWICCNIFFCLMDTVQQMKWYETRCDWYRIRWDIFKTRDLTDPCIVLTQQGSNQSPVPADKHSAVFSNFISRWIGRQGRTRGARGSSEKLHHIYKVQLIYFLCMCWFPLASSRVYFFYFGTLSENSDFATIGRIKSFTNSTCWFNLSILYIYWYLLCCWMFWIVCCIGFQQVMGGKITCKLSTKTNIKVSAWKKKDSFKLLIYFKLVGYFFISIYFFDK